MKHTIDLDDVTEESLAVVQEQVKKLKEKSAEGILIRHEADALIGYMRNLSLVQKDRREAKKETDGDAARMTDEELKAAIIKMAEEFKGGKR